MIEFSMDNYMDACDFVYTLFCFFGVHSPLLADKRSYRPKGGKRSVRSRTAWRRISARSPCLRTLRRRVLPGRSAPADEREGVLSGRQASSKRSAPAGSVLVEDVNLRFTDPG